METRQGFPALDRTILQERTHWHAPRQVIYRLWISRSVKSVRVVLRSLLRGRAFLHEPGSRIQLLPRELSRVVTLFITSIEFMEQASFPRKVGVYAPHESIFSLCDKEVAYNRPCPDQIVPNPPRRVTYTAPLQTPIRGLPRDDDKRNEWQICTCEVLLPSTSRREDS